MAEITPRPSQVAKVFNGSIDATKVEVTDDSEILIYSISILNATAAEAYLQVWDKKEGDVTVGADTTFILGVDAASQEHFVFPVPIRFGTGFTIASATARDGSSDAVQEVTITFLDSLDRTE